MTAKNISVKEIVEGQGVMRGNVLHMQIAREDGNYDKRNFVLPEGSNPFAGRHPDCLSLANTGTGYFSCTVVVNTVEKAVTVTETSEVYTVLN